MAKGPVRQNRRTLAHCPNFAHNFSKLRAKLQALGEWRLVKLCRVGNVDAAARYAWGHGPIRTVQLLRAIFRRIA